MSISLFLLLVDSWVGILIVMMLFMTFAEMFAFPFSNSFAISRAPKGHEGRYMAIFTMSYSAAHILSSKIGMTLVDYFDYNTNWLVMGILGLLGTASGYWVYQLVQKENAKYPVGPTTFEHPAEGGEREI
jgi:dipeptide/tripeptide permease